MKSPDQAVAQVAARLRSNWSEVVAGAHWTPRFPLGTSELDSNMPDDDWVALHRQKMAWDDWEAWAEQISDGIKVIPRIFLYRSKSSQPVPAHLIVADVDAAAALIGKGWPERVARGRTRRDLLVERFPGFTATAWLLKHVDAWSDVDFDLLCRVAKFFAEPHEAGLTPRQVPVIGLGTKWLDKRRTVVRRLAGVEELDLIPGRPQRVHFTYLDPDHRDSGGRHHDLVTVGDVDSVAYRPRVVVISENRDTAQQFPAIDGGIAIEGDGNGPGGVPRIEWVREAEEIYYWGDMDSRGLEILNGFRAAGLQVTSLFMDMTAYEQWVEFGVDHDDDGKPLVAKAVPWEVADLEPGERALYLALCSPEWPLHRRIEQERIPLTAAAAVVRGDVPS